MKAATFFLLIICGISAEQEQQEVKARPGQNVSLPCPGPQDASIIVFFWKRSDLPDGYLLFYRENRFHEHYQHATFRGRVELTPSPMRDGDFSVVLQNVSTEDEGTYDCLVKTRNPGGDSSEWRHSILLTVSGEEEPEEAGGELEPPKDRGDENREDENRGDKNREDEDRGDKNREDEDREERDKEEKIARGILGVSISTVIFLYGVFCIQIFVMNRRRPA